MTRAARGRRRRELFERGDAPLARSLHGRWLRSDEKAHRRFAAEGVSHRLTDALPPGW